MSHSSQGTHLFWIVVLLSESISSVSKGQHKLVSSSASSLTSKGLTDAWSSVSTFLHSYQFGFVLRDKNFSYAAVKALIVRIFPRHGPISSKSR